MRYMALACDYDGTLARDGHVDEETVTALERVRSSGRLLLLVTGRELDDLLKVCPHTALFDYIVAENGAVLYVPATGTERLLGTRPPEAFVDGAQGARGAPPVCRTGDCRDLAPTRKHGARNNSGPWA